MASNAHWQFKRSPDGEIYGEGTYAAPWQGLNSQDPAIYLDPSESPALSNTWLRNKYILSAPPFVPVFPGPDGKNAPLGQTSFTDANGVVHTLAWTSKGLWQLNTQQPPQRPWQFLGGDALAANIQWLTVRSPISSTTPTERRSCRVGTASRSAR